MKTLKLFFIFLLILFSCNYSLKLSNFHHQYIITQIYYNGSNEKYVIKSLPPYNYSLSDMSSLEKLNVGDTVVIDKKDRLIIKK
jgi:hypothetical protein